MMTMDNEEAIKAAARHWLLRLSLESPTRQERAQFAAWCAQDPRHAAAYQRFESIWQDAATLEELEPLAGVLPARDSWWRRLRASLTVQPLRWAGGAGLTAVVTGIGLWILFAPAFHDTGIGRAPPLTQAQYTTAIAEVRAIHLPDGSEVTLGARSSLEVAFRRDERRVTLTSGVAFFSVVKNPSRPFVVRVGDDEVRDVGTQFEIQREPTGTRVSVVEGAVEVMQVPERAGKTGVESPLTARLSRRLARAAGATIRSGVPNAANLLTEGGSPSGHILTAGLQVTLAPNGAIRDPRALSSVEPAAWRYGRLVYVDTPLKNVIADANRYSREPIEIADARVANIRVSVTYPSDRIEEMVSAVAHSLSLEVERRAGGGIVLKASAPGD